MSHTIAIIGGGNLGNAIGEGLLAGGFVQPSNLTITRRNTDALQSYKDSGVKITSDNVQAVTESEWVIFAVKPFQIRQLLTELAPFFAPGKHKVISVLTGVWLKELKEALPEGVPVFRAMPNTAVSIRQSITCISSDGASVAEQEFVKGMFDLLGRSVWIDEQLMDAATVLGACGIAYAMRFIRANIQGGIEIGFDAATASLIAEQTVKGAAELLLTRGLHPEQEIDKVTTPKGCTIAGLNEMEHQGFSSALIKGILTSYEKI